MSSSTAVGFEIDPFMLPRVALDDKITLPSSPGIYFVIDGARLLYVGKSKDLKGRWRGHHRHKQIDAIADCPEIAFLEVAGESLLWVERDLINRFRPLLNDTKMDAPKELTGPIDMPTSEQLINFLAYAEMEEVFKFRITANHIYELRRTEDLKNLAMDANKLISGKPELLKEFLEYVQIAFDGVREFRESYGK
jgi:hypothetical protein